MLAAPSSGRPRQRYRPPDLNFFRELTPSSLYWLGFLMADGCVGRRQLIVVLQARDADHLRRLQAVLGCEDRPLAPANDGRGRRLLIGSAALARQLNGFGIVAGRAGRLTGLDRRLVTSPDFWRGVVDGDGSIRFDAATGMPSLVLVGAPGLTRQFSQFLSAHFADGFLPTPYRHSQSPRVRLVSVGGRHAKAAVECLYGMRPTDVLHRKMQRAQRVMAWTPAVESRYPWERWTDGAEWLLRRDEDYTDARRLWERARRVARDRGQRIVLIEQQSCLRLRFVDPDGPGARNQVTFVHRH